MKVTNKMAESILVIEKFVSFTIIAHLFALYWSITPKFFFLYRALRITNYFIYGLLVFEIIFRDQFHVF